MFNIIMVIKYQFNSVKVRLQLTFKLLNIIGKTILFYDWLFILYIGVKLSVMLVGVTIHSVTRASYRNK